MRRSPMVIFVALALLPACQNRGTDFAGAWVLRDQGRNVMVLKLTQNGDQATGTLIMPEHFQFDGDGTFSHLRGGPVENAVSKGKLASGILEFTVAAPDGPESMSMLLRDGNHAEVRFSDAPGWIAPLKFERIAESQNPAVEKDWPQAGPITPEITALQTRLKAMAEEDQAVRLARPLSDRNISAVDQKNLPEILRIHETYGWPKQSVAGKEAAGNFWLLVQHQGHDLQKKWLPDMERLVKEGEASQQNFALLYDRVQKGDGKPQRWGTQTSCVNGKAVMDTVEDPQGLDQRRRELYLQPIQEYVRSLDEWCQASALQ